MTTLQTTLHLFYFKPFLTHYIIKIIEFISNTNVCGYDEITIKIMKQCKNELPVLTHLLNLSIESGTFPNLLKLSIVKPIHKQGNK